MQEGIFFGVKQAGNNYQYSLCFLEEKKAFKITRKSFFKIYVAESVYVLAKMHVFVKIRPIDLSLALPA